MKFDYSVVYNGKFYRAGEEVPMPVKDEKASEKASSVAVETEKDENENTPKTRKKAVKTKEEANN